MKPFNLEAALAGKPVVTRDGQVVTQLTYFKATLTYPVYGVVAEKMEMWTTSGVTEKDKYDLFMLEESVAPETEAPTKGTKYWVPCFTEEDFVGDCIVWADDEFDLLLLKRKLIHLCKENAITQAKEMLNIQ